ncbi:MAG: MBL fold metallo-hydrolase [Proteobacteria bacterium]|nr:MBL fold metallo-hydrolase [Pseudomonadota bacterium]
MTELVAVDRLEIHVLVDNATDMLSSTPAHVETEGAGLMRRGVRVMGGKCLCCAAHGLACLVTAWRGDLCHVMLFDSGPEDYAFERNVTRLGVDLGSVEAIALSHGHWDHAGAMLLALGMIRARNGGRDVPYYAHPGMFRTRAVRQADGTLRQLEDVPGIHDLTAFGAQVVNTTTPQVLLDSMFYLSGEIPRVSGFEVGYPGQVRRREDGTGWEPDELLLDERFLALDVAGKGLVVISACSHAGIINVLSHARELFPHRPLHGVLGGLHLSGTNERVIAPTVEGLRTFGLATIAAGHCTGWRAMAALAAAFGDTVLAPTAVGKRYRF